MEEEQEKNSEIDKFIVRVRVRYCCPNCLKTFADNTFLADRFCWKCGETLTSDAKLVFHED